MVLMVAVTVASVIFFIRSLMVMIGFFKEPILQAFREYGPMEKPYLPMLPLMAWTGMMFFSAGIWLGRSTNLSFAITLMGVMMMIATGFAYNNYAVATRYHFLFLKLPAWYHELLERTTRYERRRIGYMWLHLPLRMRLTYNSSDFLFLQWADFVIMGTIREDEDDMRQTVDEGYMLGRDWWA
ncbi:MAG: hypothetical protein K8L97_13365 [Anaerolineae bacterium]|nr:hypothetical protein [Anaerolineae bacterium]